MPSAIVTTLRQVGATALKPLMPAKSRIAPAAPRTIAPPTRSARPWLRNHLRPEISDPTADLKLEKRSGVSLAVVLDPVAEAREPLGAVHEDRVDDLRYGRLERLDGRLDVGERELEVGDLLRPQPAPDLLLGRHLLARGSARAGSGRRGSL